MTDDFVAAAVKHATVVAKKTARTRGFASDEWQDVRQELLLDLIRRYPSFNPSRGSWATFMSHLMRNRASTLVSSIRRRHQTETSDISGAEFSKYVDQHAIQPQSVDVSVDVRTVTALLPPHLRN